MTAFKVRAAVVGVDEATRLKRPGIAFWALAGVFVAICVATWFVEGNLASESTTFASKAAALMVVLSGAVLGLVFHEWAHAIVAFWGGDRTVADKGYLTMDVRDYSNPLLSIGMPMLFLMLGGLPLPGGAVWINHHYLRSKWWDSAVSLAGPAINLLGALAIYGFVATGILGSHDVLSSALMFLAYLEIGIVILNLLPIPGLDGYGAIEPHLADGVQAFVAPVKRYSMVILLIVIMNGAALGFIWDMAADFTLSLGVNGDLIGYGETLADPRLL